MVGQRRSDPEFSETTVSEALAGAIGRDFKTPLHSLLGFLELLGMSDLTDEQRRTFEYVMTGADTLARSADRLLLLCRSVAGDQPDRSQAFEVSELLGAAAAGTPADVRITLDQRIPARLVGDVVGLKQMLGELLDNAVTHARGPLTLALEAAGDVSNEAVPLQISVFDGGPGMSEDRLAFVRAPLAIMPDPGQGLGLYLVKRILAQAGGRLVATSGARGAATVSAYLTLAPAAVVDPKPAAPETLAGGSASDAAAHRRLKVLLVEDNAVNLILARRQMKLLGHDLQTATGGELGVQAALDGDFDLILMDRHLPDLDGVDAARQIRQAESMSGRRTPIIAVTADAMPRNREECLAAGMDGFLTKPLDLDELSATLSGFLPSRLDAVSVDDPDVVDLSALRDLAERLGAPEMVAELAHAYLAELAGRRLRLQGAIRRSSVGDILTTAEALRAPSQTVGAVRLAALCQDIIEAARTGNTLFAHDMVPALRDACQLTTSAMASTQTLAAV